MQIKAARDLLEIDQETLADAIGSDKAVISRIENGTTKAPQKATLDKIINYFESRKIEILPTGGVTFKPENTIQKLKGADGFLSFMRDVYETTKAMGGEICVSNVDERNWIKWMTQEAYDKHAAKMKILPENYNFKIFVKEGDDFFIASKIAEYRYVPSEFFTDQSFYVYGDKLALIAFDEDDVLINIIHSARWAESFRVLFNYAWDNTPPIGMIGKTLNKTP